jgi:hypothetical protein
MTDTTNEYLGATPPRKNKLGLAEETPQTSERSPLHDHEKHPTTLFGNAPDNFKPRTYMLSETAMNRLKKVFTKADKGTGHIKVADLPALLEDVFGTDGQPAPIAVDVAYLLQKHGLDSDLSELDLTTFRQLILDLVSPKHISLLENKNLKLTNLQGNKNFSVKTHDEHARTFHRLFSVQEITPHRVKFDLEVESPKRTHELSPEGGGIAKNVFKRYCDPETNQLKHKHIFIAVSETFEADNRLTPSPSVFDYLLRKLNVREDESISFHTFQKFVQELCAVEKHNPDAFDYYMD